MIKFQKKQKKLFYQFYSKPYLPINNKKRQTFYLQEKVAHLDYLNQQALFFLPIHVIVEFFHSYIPWHTLLLLYSLRHSHTLTQFHFCILYHISRITIYITFTHSHWVSHFCHSVLTSNRKNYLTMRSIAIDIVKSSDNRMYNLSHSPRLKPSASIYFQPHHAYIQYNTDLCCCLYFVPLLNYFLHHNCNLQFFMLLQINRIFFFILII